MESFPRPRLDVEEYTYVHVRASTVTVNGQGMDYDVPRILFMPENRYAPDQNTICKWAGRSSPEWGAFYSLGETRATFDSIRFNSIRYNPGGGEGGEAS